MPLCFVMILFLSLSAFASDEPSWNRVWRGFPEVLAILKTVPEGREILRQAEAKNPDYLSQIKAGSASFTESTFARTYSLLDGREHIELRHEVTLNQSLSLANATVDLAHELIHYAEKDMLDPYKPGFELKEFVENGLEGVGGELAALEKECQVAWALEAKYRTFPTHRLCHRYRMGKNSFDRKRARKDYFALGPWISSAPPELKKAFPEVSGSPVVFTSSYASKPYPIALAEEFQATKRAACLNNRKKYRLIAAQASGGREPASANLAYERVRLKAYDRLYCQSEKEKP